MGVVTAVDGTTIEVDETFISKYPVLYDSLYIVGGTMNDQALFDQNVMEFIDDTYKHFKPLGVATTGKAYFNDVEDNNLSGVVFAAKNANFPDEFITAIGKRRFWDRI